MLFGVAVLSYECALEVLPNVLLWRVVNLAAC